MPREPKSDSDPSLEWKPPGCFMPNGSWNPEAAEYNALTYAVKRITAARRQGTLTPRDAVMFILHERIEFAFDPEVLDSWRTMTGYDGSHGTWLWPHARVSRSIEGCIQRAGFSVFSDEYKQQRYLDSKDGPRLDPAEAAAKIGTLFNLTTARPLETIEQPQLQLEPHDEFSPPPLAEE